MSDLPLSKYFYPHFIIGLITSLVLISTTELIIKLFDENQLERKHRSVVDKSKAVRARIEGEFNSMFYLSAGLMAHVAAHPKINEQDFSIIASEIIAAGRNLRNIALAKDNTITHIYPLAGNEAALGLKYESLTSQWPAVKKAIDLKGTVVAGPLNLVQGGKGIIVRSPIYTRRGLSGNLQTNRPGYWGIASLVINSDGFFKSAEFNETNEGVEFALRGKDGLGENGELIFGKPQLFTSNAIFTSINLPNGSWQLAAKPAEGWGFDKSKLWGIRTLGWLCSILLGALLTALSISRQMNRDLAFYDELTTLPNRRLLDDRMLQVLAYSKRYKASFGLFYLDLDGFKNINDQYGHKVGDGLLVEASKRMLASVRATDTVARVGGDEFIVLVNDIRQQKDMCNIRSQLERNLLGTANINGKEISIHASIGYAIYPNDEDTLDGLKHRADQRMYEEKKQKSNNQAN